MQAALRTAVLPREVFQVYKGCTGGNKVGCQACTYSKRASNNPTKLIR